MSRIRWFVLLGLLGVFHAQSAQALSSRALDAVPLHVVPAQAAAHAREQIPADPTGHAPLRLSVGVPMDLSLADGSWSNDETTGIATWRARVYSAGATLLIASFDRFDLPDGAELWVTDTAGSIVNGPYTRREHGASTLEPAMVPGEEMLIEVRVPEESRDAVDLHLAGIGHGVHDFEGTGVLPKSGTCNIDVACSQGNGWRDQIRSVVRLQIPTGALGGAVLCSGQLVNNTAGLTNRYFLITANHCGANASTAANVTAYFNFQTTTCGGTRTENPSSFPRQTGTTFRASHSRGDHTLLEFNVAPSSSLNVFYSGFDAGGTSSASSGASIHHPAGHEKRISLFSDNAPRVSGQSVGTFVVDAFRVRWAPNSGVTEQGSSGGGLWNQSGRLIGVLSGGASSCSNQSGYDYFGRLDVAWASLVTHLDTTGTGASSVAGRNATGVPPTSGGGGTGDTASDSDSGGGGGGGGGSFGTLATVLMLIAGLLRRVAPRLTSRRASRGAGAA